MNNIIRTLIIRFDNEIQPFEIPLLRGSVLSSVGKEADVLLHNHEGDNFRYSFPLVQYKRMKGKACIVCIEEGADVIGQFFSTQSTSFQIGERSVLLQIEEVLPRKTTIQIWDSEFRYRLRRWLPLNSQNYEEYQKAEAMTEKIALLERILIGNILSMAKGLGIRFDKQVSCSITDLTERHLVKVKNTKVMMFDVDFKSNASLPEWVGIGKHASIGFGIITRDKHNNIQNNDEQYSA